MQYLEYLIFDFERKTKTVHTNCVVLFYFSSDRHVCFYFILQGIYEMVINNQSQQTFARALIDCRLLNIKRQIFYSNTGSEQVQYLNFIETRARNGTSGTQ